MEWNSKAEIFIISAYIVIPALLIILVLTVLILVIRELIRSRKDGGKKE